MGFGPIPVLHLGVRLCVDLSSGGRGGVPERDCCLLEVEGWFQGGEDFVEVAFFLFVEMAFLGIFFGSCISWI